MKRITKHSMEKNFFFAPSSKGLGAMRRAAMLLVMLLTMAQGAWAATVEETVTWLMDGTGVSGNIVSNGTGNSLVLKYESWFGHTAAKFTSINGIDGNYLVTSDKQQEISFPDITGTVVKVEVKGFCFNNSGLNLYAGTSMNNLLNKSTGGTAYPSWDENGQYNGDVTYTGSINVSSSSPLKLMFRAASSIPSYQLFMFKNGSISVTYQKEVAPDPQHSFSTPSVSGNTLTVTCTNNAANHECNLTNRQATLTLSVEDSETLTFSQHPASLNLGEFNDLTNLKATSGNITYTNKTTGVSYMSAGFVTNQGSYTASVDVTVNSTVYTLTKDFKLIDGFKVNNSYSQFSVNPASALEGEAITITYTQQMDESLDGLTLRGATSGNNIAYTQSGNTYTFTMPAEDVNLSATITYPLNENNITQSGSTYTIKTADGWDYFCRRMEVDGELNGFSGKAIELAADISVTTMAGYGIHPFKGTFDGKGHTLDFKPTTATTYCAPFQNTNNATICNLHATGQIEGGNWNYIGGLVGSANGNLTIENCRVSTLISSTVSGTAFNGGFVGYLSSQYNQCQITGCVFDGLIYNPDNSGITYGCGGFVGAMSQYAYVDLTDCLFIHGQYDNGGGKCELWWGNENDKNSTFFHRSNNYGGGTLTNCFYVGTRGLKQGSPAVESADAPDNFAHFGDPTDHGFMQTYGHTMVFDGKYYTPTYGDLVETYDYSGVKSYIIEYDDMPLGIKDVKTKQRTNYLCYNRPFTKDKAVTIMLPFDFTKNDIRRGEYDNISEGKFYEFAGIEEVPFNVWIAVMKEVGVEGSNEVTTMKANTPYLFMPGEDAKYLYFTNGDDYNQGFDIFTEGYERGNKQTEYDGSNESFRWNKWNFKGTYEPRYWSDSENPEEIGKVYGFAGVEKEVDEHIVVAGDFVRAKSGAKIRPTSCYLMWAGSEPSNARALTRSAAATEELPQRITVRLVGSNGEVTGIGTLSVDNGQLTIDNYADADDWYDLQGRKLSGKPTQKGLYINNGRKIVIK